MAKSLVQNGVTYTIVRGKAGGPWTPSSTGLSSSSSPTFLTLLSTGAVVADVTGQGVWASYDNDNSWVSLKSDGLPVGPRANFVVATPEAVYVAMTGMSGVYEGAVTQTSGLRFKTAAQALTAGQASTTMTVVLVDSSGHIQNAGAGGVTIGLSSTSAAGNSFQVMVTALDASSHADPTFGDLLHFSSTDPHAVLPPDQVFNGTGGTESFTVTLKTAGLQTVTVTDLSRPAGVRVQPGKSSSSVNAAGASSLSVIGFPTTAMLGAPGKVTVTALDAYGNRAVGYRGQIQFSIQGGQAILPGNYSFLASDNGVHSFSVVPLTLGSGESLTATDTLTASISGSQSGITVVSPATHLAITASPGATAGQSFTVTVTALSASGRPDASFLDTIHFASSDPRANLPADYPFQAQDGGSHTFTVVLDLAGISSLAVSDTTRPALPGASASVTVKAGQATALQVIGFPSAALPGVAYHFRVRAVDAYGNQAPSYRGTIQIQAASGGTVISLPTYTYTAADHGIHNFTLTLPTTGTWSLSGTDTTNATITGTETGIVVSDLTANISGPAAGARGQPLNFTLSATEASAAAGTVFTFVIDWNGNGVGTQRVSGPSGMTVSHVYPGIGNHTIRVTVTDPVGPDQLHQVTSSEVATFQ